MSMLMLFMAGWLLADQNDPPAKGRFEVFPQSPYRVSKLEQQAKGADRTTIWSTNFSSSTGWDLAYAWNMGTPTMGPDTVPDGNGCLATNLAGFYANDSNIRALSPSIPIPAASYVELSFTEWFQLESDYDFGWVEIKQGSTYYSVDARSGTSGGQWRETSIDVTRWQGNSIQVVFHLTSDASVPALGWYLDCAAIDIVEPHPLELDITGINISNLPSVYLTASVRSPDGPVTTLTQSNFSVWENSSAQTNLFSVIAPDNSQTASSTDIVFVLDVTGSMGDEIASVRANMQAFMNHLQGQNMDYRIGFVVFGDIVYVYNQYFFYTSFTEIMNIISNIELGEHNIGSGGDGPENQLEAMAEGSVFSWRPGASRVMIMLTDATAHEADYVTDWTVNDLLAQRLLPNEVMVFPIFNTNNSGQLAQYLPIAQQTNPSAACYYIYDNFNVIISEIGNYITSLYTVHYISPVQADDPMSRIVKLTASSGADSSEDYAFYLPGISPIITREAELEALDYTPVPAVWPLELEVVIEDRVPPGLLTQSIIWRHVGTSAWYSAPMTMIKEDYYQAILPANQVSGVGIEYYISASDGQTSVTLPSSEPELHPFSIAVSPAGHASFGTPTASYSSSSQLAVSVTATAFTTPQLKLYYRPMGALIYEEAAMAQSGNNFSATINQNLGSLGVQYYILCTQANQLITYLGNPDEPLYVAAGAMVQQPSDHEALIFDSRAWPNPVSLSQRAGYVSIGFSLKEETSVQARIYNLRGQLVKELSDKHLVPGQHTLWWDLKDKEGARVSSGVYLYRLQADGYAASGKLLIAQ